MKKTAKRILSAILAFSLAGLSFSVNTLAEEIAENAETVQASAEQYELSSFSVYYENSRNLEYTIPIGYEFTIDDIDIENIRFKKTYEVSLINSDGEKVICRYDNEWLDFEEIQKECEITTKLQTVSETKADFIISLKYKGDEAESVLINSLWIRLNYDVDDHSFYGENFLSSETYVIVDDGENSEVYLFDGGERLSYLLAFGIEERPCIVITEQNNKILLDCGAYYVKAHYNFNIQDWSYSGIILKNDTVIVSLNGSVASVDNEKNTFTAEIYKDNELKYVEYPVDAEFVYIAQDLDKGNNIRIYGYNVTSDDWYINPNRVFVEPSYKVTISGKITKISGDIIYADFDGIERSFFVSDTEGVSVGGNLYVKGYGDCITDEWFENPIEVWAEKSTDYISDEKILYGDANCDEIINICDLTAIKQHIVQLSELSEKGIKNCDFFGDGLITVKNLGQMSKYLVKLIENL